MTNKAVTKLLQFWELVIKKGLMAFELLLKYYSKKKSQVVASKER